MTTKTGGQENCVYSYNLQGRMSGAMITRLESGQNVNISSSYTYDPSGIRTRAGTTVNGVVQNQVFLVDQMNHTGYAQVLEELNAASGDAVKSYTLGDDVLSQSVNGMVSHLLYDGHGSTRMLTSATGAITARYDYDAYGMMSGGNPGVTTPAATDFLYSGEQFDHGLQMQYLRARYYDQNTGRFNSLDPFAGNNYDPQSLHKYAYCHGDPVNGIDPSGEFFIEMTLGMAVMLVIAMTVTVGSIGLSMKSASTREKYTHVVIYKDMPQSGQFVNERFIRRKLLSDTPVNEVTLVYGPPPAGTVLGRHNSRVISLHLQEVLTIPPPTPGSAFIAPRGTGFGNGTPTVWTLANNRDLKNVAEERSSRTIPSNGQVNLNTFCALHEILHELGASHEENNTLSVMNKSLTWEGSAEGRSQITPFTRDNLKKELWK